MDRNLTGDTEAYVGKLHDTQEKDEKNRRTQGRKRPGRSLPNNKH
ncbi:DUF4023 domain-containing protein [Paenibacillus filicis]|uniref:DUF4023 domain-containing protein n=1 Tax=Paenibacillus gyeongsangnamensis TaxID=3388067 RepID=A0ABT4QCU8_9BACL|nr:DUF4023 domain-containing protein [Paenibacillus filicis]MCZ8514681.1 DUF4023 domain-containing protein [Paenibacillus filicis]